MSYMYKTDEKVLMSEKVLRKNVNYILIYL